MNRVVTAALSGVLVVGSIGISSWTRFHVDLAQARPKSELPVQVIGAVHPRVSPDGNTAVFSYQGAIWAMEIASRPPRIMKRLTSGDGLDIEPVWSPDGKSVAFLRSQDWLGGEVQYISVSFVDPTPTRAKAPPPWPKTRRGAAAPRANGKLNSHPDGRRLLASFVLPGEKPVEGLAWLDLQTGNLRSVFDPPRAIRRAALSGDGNWIVFATHLDVPGEQQGNDGPQADLWRVASAGGEPQHVVRFPARVFDLCWGPDDKDLIAVSDLGGAHYDLWRVPLDRPERAEKLTLGQADEDRPSLCAGGRMLFTDNRTGATLVVVRDSWSHLQQESFLAVQERDWGGVRGKIGLRIIDADTKKSIVARVCVEEDGDHLGGLPRKFHAPVGSLYRLDRAKGHFYCRGDAEWELPAGRYRLHVWRGPEYRAHHQQIEVTAGQQFGAEIKLERWANFADYQFYSGENHIHANYGYGEWYNTPQSMLDQCEGEDLNVCNFMVANSDGDGVFDREFFRGRPDTLSSPRTVLYWNEEFRSTSWGHMTLVNLKQLVEPIFTGFRDTTNPWDVPTNADIADRTHLGRGLVNYTHAAQNAADPYLGAYTAKAIPVDVALGKIDTVDINNSYDGTVPLWHRLLNCGFRLPASAGTDCFLNRIRSRLPGSDRAYVRIEGEFSYDAWIEGLRAGRSFVTNGPLLELIVDGAKRPGDTLELPADAEVKIVGKALSQFPIDRAELIFNGQVAAAANLKDGRVEEVFERTVRIDRSGWLALVASGPPHADLPAGKLYAHTSPIYVRVAGKPAGSRVDAEYFLAWIDRLEAALRQRDRIPSDALKTHVADQLNTARAVYRRIAAEVM
jgi:hypothetical protein